MLKKSYRWLAVVLAVSVLLSCLPMSVFALDNSDADVIVEDESQREESVKHFQMPDGSYTAVVYTKPVHRKDSDGVWQDIDNRMEESTVKNKQAYVTSDGRTVFSKKITGDDPTVFALSENGYSIKVSFDDGNIKNTTAKLSNHAKKYEPTGADDVETQYKKLKTIDNNTTVSYKNLLKGMTLEYVLSGNDVKENIIIHKKTDGYVYSFIYELEGLSASLDEDGSIDLVSENSGEPVGSIPAPYMYDDDGAVSYDVSYTLEDLGDGMYKLTVSANEEWINSSERAFPVVIDPTMTFTIDSMDTYIYSGAPDMNYGDSEKLWVSSLDITFMHFAALPRLGDYATVTNATLNLHYYYYIDTGSLTVGAYQVTENWNEYSLTWNTAQEMLYEGVSPFCIGTAILPASPFFKSSSTPGLAAIDVTDLVQAWFAGMPNYGVAIKFEGGSNSSVILNSKETYTGAYYEITYTTDRTIYAPIDNGVYFLENKQVEGYVQIDNNASTNTEGAILELWSWDGENDQRWKFTYLRNGYYKIISVASGKAITAPSELNEALTQESYQISADQLWQITSAGNGLYHIAPRSKPTYRMAAGDGVGNNGRNVEMREQQSDNQDEWKFELVDTYAITFYGVSNSFHNHSGCLETVQDNLHSANFNNVILKTGAIDPSDCLAGLKNSNVFTSRSHGRVAFSEGTNTAASTGIVLNDQDGPGMVALYSHFWGGMTVGSTSIDATNAFIRLNLALFIGCETAYDGEAGRNLPAIVSNQGAEVAIGFSDPIDCNAANQWTKDFYSYLLEGHTVQESVNYASSRRSVASGLRSAVVCGNGNYRIIE